MNTDAIPMFQSFNAIDAKSIGTQINKHSIINPFQVIQNFPRYEGYLEKKRIRKASCATQDAHLGVLFAKSQNKELETKAYSTPSFRITKTKLEFEIGLESIKVVSNLTILNENRADTLILQGTDLQLNYIKIDDITLPKEHYSVDQTSLRIYKLPNKLSFKIKTETVIYPKQNKTSAGITASQGIYWTQCEPTGFSRITYYLDRPDILSTFSVKLIAEKDIFPVLLSTGQEIAKGLLPDGQKHFVEFYDPSPKPPHQFTLVAGSFGCKNETFITKNYHHVHVRLYTPKGKESQAAYAWSILREAMRWDEKHYGKEYANSSLSLVAIDNFEGKSSERSVLLFDSAKILADPLITTDEKYQEIETTVAQEYFLSCMGEQIKVRDWSETPLKEGLMNFFYQEFMASKHSSFLQRANDVAKLEKTAFTAVEWGGMEGAEILRMLRILIGSDTFQQGVLLYLSRYDGKLCTIEDFMNVMKEVSKEDLSSFCQWFSQKNLPEVTVSMQYDEKNREACLEISQKTDTNKNILRFPFSIGLLDQKGKALRNTYHVPITDRRTWINFEDIHSKPIPSLLRNFSAPVKVSYNYTPAELALLFVHDQVLFNRYQSGQKLILLCLQNLVESIQQQRTFSIPGYILETFSKVFRDYTAGLSFRSMALALPKISNIVQEWSCIDPEALYEAYSIFTELLANHLEKDLLHVYKELYPKLPYGYDHASIATRGLRNFCLKYLASFKDLRYLYLLKQSYDTAENMTDRLHALELLCHAPSNLENVLSIRKEALEDFYNKWKQYPALLSHWFAIQASTPFIQHMDAILILDQHPAFDKTSSRMLVSLYKTFTENFVCFHHKSGVGYRYIADKIIEIDPFHPQVSAELIKAFQIYPKLPDLLKEKMKEQLLRIKETIDLSNPVENVIKTLLPTESL